MSIISNPRPGIRPFFGSKSDILPAIKDQVIVFIKINLLLGNRFG